MLTRVELVARPWVDRMDQMDHALDGDDKWGL